MKKRNSIIIFFILLISSLTVLGFFAETLIEPVKEWLFKLDFWAIPAFLAAYIVATALALPKSPLSIIAGSVFGLYQGFMLVSAADVLGAAACFLIGRVFARETIETWFKCDKHFLRLEQVLKSQTWKILFLTRISPLIPSNILNYGLSCTGVRVHQFLLSTWIGMLPSLFLYTYIGSFGSSLLQARSEPQGLIIRGVGLLIAVSTALYITFLAKRELSRQEGHMSKATPCDAEPA